MTSNRAVECFRLAIRDLVVAGATGGCRGPPSPAYRAGRFTPRDRRAARRRRRHATRMATVLRTARGILNCSPPQPAIRAQTVYAAAAGRSSHSNLNVGRWTLDVGRSELVARVTQFASN